MVVFEVRHEARFQCVAGLARRSRTGEDADRASRVESCARARRHAEVRPGESRQLGRDGPGGGSGALRGRSRSDPRCHALKASTRDAHAQARRAHLREQHRRRHRRQGRRYLTVIVPFGTVPNDSMPSGFDPKPAPPLGVSFTGLPAASHASSSSPTRSNKQQDAARRPSWIRCGATLTVREGAALGCRPRGAGALRRARWARCARGAGAPCGRVRQGARLPLREVQAPRGREVRARASRAVRALPTVAEYHGQARAHLCMEWRRSLRRRDQRSQ